MKQHLNAPVIVGITIASVLVLFLIAGAVGSSQRACVTCHTDYAKAQGQTAHSSVRCAACHAPGLAGRIGIAGVVVGRMLPAQLLGIPVAGPVTQTSRQACLACHSQVTQTVSSGTNGLRIKHATCARTGSCDSCHSTTGHGTLTRWKREPIMQDCTACHVAQNASVACTACHVGKTTNERLAVGPWQVTHGPNWQVTHGMGKLDSCVSCHPKDYCVQCHKVVVPHDATFGSQHGQAAILDRQACLTCHKTETFCNACHGIEMPHPAGFLKTHSSVAKSVDNPTCQRCHTTDTCDRCHVAHVHPGFAAVHKGASATSTAGQP